MINERNVFLFGAGSVLSWGAPSTSELTELILKSGFPITNSNIRMTQFIYDTLLESGFHKDDINFETIINVIEELSVFYSKFNVESRSPSLLAPFLESKFDEKIMNFTIKGGERKHGYQLEIPKQTEYLFSKSSFNNESPKQFFLQHQLMVLLTEINNRISSYAYHTDGYSKIDKNSKDSLLFRNWMNGMSRNEMIRIYTLNYDRLFKNILEDDIDEIFEGFDNPNAAMPGRPSILNVKRIINDNKCHCFFNLHGSSYWRVKALNRNLLPIPEFVFDGAPHLPMNEGSSTIQFEKGKPVMLSNIVTGYQKSQKAMIAPFKQMQSAFDRDCINTDKIFIIGYSFGDEHINQSIKMALRYNQDVKIEIVDPSFLDNGMEHKFSINFLPYCAKSGLIRKDISEKIKEYQDGKVTVYAMKFDEYLEHFMNKEQTSNY